MISRRKFLGFLAALPGVDYKLNGAEAATPAPDPRITHAKIHPALGFARIGNSRTDFYIGPEVPEAPTLPAGSYKDGTGALKRQVARFRVYGYNAAGEVVRELTPDNAAITWTAHLANKKAAWYQFQMALDIPEALRADAAPARRRNPQYTGAARQQLVIDPGARAIEGKATQGAAYQFNTGAFVGQTVPLGELRTDENGRLLVFGGLGLSRSSNGRPPEDFANNNNWHDDISDGPVDAQVTVESRAIPVEGAWVVVAPPNYAPSLKTVRTLHDYLYDRHIAWGWAKGPEKISFVKNIAPIFRRLTGLQWVNQGFAADFGFGAPYEAGTLQARLADAADSNKTFRQQMYARFRNPAERRLGKLLWPSLYGDAWDYLTDSEPDVSTRLVEAMATLSDTQLGWLKRWADGDFTNDLAAEKPAAQKLEEFPVAEQPAALDRAALDFCVADAFHPGCEVTWIVRHQSLFSGPLRIRRRPEGVAEPDFGPIMTPAIALAPNGPLGASGPGDLTRWMAVPWQTDTATCLYAYDFFRTSASLPSFWPARVPNDVLSEVEYHTAINPALPLAQRQAAFATRRDWFRGLGDPEDVPRMVTDFYKMGIIEIRPGATDTPQLPAQMLVESRPNFPLAEFNGQRAGARIPSGPARLAREFRRRGREPSVG